MLKFRIVTTGAILAFAVSAAAAQSNDTDTTGTPISFFKLLFHTTDAKPETKPEPQAKAEPKHAAARPIRTVRHVHQQATRVAAAIEDPAPVVEPPPAPERSPAPQPTAWTAQAAIAAAPPSIWPAGNAPIFAGVLDSEPQDIAELASSGDRTTIVPKVADAQPTPAVALAAQDDDQSDAWFEAILATLGGALAAGAVAWLVIGGAVPQRPQRMYG
jgi:hypothetical protein